jgi:NhaP-type Na+/H+ or K+/H+ antiporter
LKVITWSWLTDPEKLFVPLLWITRIVLAFQLMASALGLGSEYWAKHWRTQLTMLGLVMPLMWLTSSALLYAIIPSIGSFLHALLIGAHVTPTDPVLAAAVVQGKFAEKLIPKGVRTTIAAESIANDGTNLPFFKSVGSGLTTSHEQLHGAWLAYGCVMLHRSWTVFKYWHAVFGSRRCT